MNELVLISKDELKQLIRDEVSEFSQPVEPVVKKRFLLEEAAEYLAMPISTLRLHRTRIGGAKLGRRWTFTKDELDRFVEINRRRAAI
jgi:excisionase family DNA binding protein